MEREVVAGFSRIVPKRGSCFVLLVSKTKGVSLTLDENCDSTVQSDLCNAMARFAGGEVAESVKVAVMGNSIVLPFTNGREETGTWQGVYVCDWRDSARRGGRVDIVATMVPAEGTDMTVVNPPSRAGVAVTRSIGRGLKGTGVLALLVKHTSASVCLCNSAECAHDMEKSCNALVPEKWNHEFFQHTYEGSDDMPAHVKSAIVGASLLVPFENGEVVLSDEQEIVLCEHRNHGGWGTGGSRKIVLMAAKPARVVTKKITVSLGEPFSAITEQIASEIDVDTGIVTVATESAQTSITISAKSDNAAVANILATSLVHDKHGVHNPVCEANIIGSMKTFAIQHGKIVLPPEHDILLVSHESKATSVTLRLVLHF